MLVVLLVGFCFMFQFCMLEIAWMAHATILYSYGFRCTFAIHSSNILLCHLETMGSVVLFLVNGEH